MLEISSIQLKTLMNEKSNIVLLDIRESHEIVYGKVKGAMHIPASRLSLLLPKLARDMHYIVICRKGYRSMLATKLMCRYGFKATCLQGGYHALENECKHLVLRTI